MIVRYDCKLRAVKIMRLTSWSLIITESAVLSSIILIMIYECTCRVFITSCNANYLLFIIYNFFLSLLFAQPHKSFLIPRKNINIILSIQVLIMFD